MLASIDKGFLSLVLRVREESLMDGVRVIDDEDALVLYTIVYIHMLGRRSGVVVDAGAGMGYSSLWLAKALEDSCSDVCRLIALEWNPRRAQVLESNLVKAGFRRVDHIVVASEAIDYLERMEPESIDVAFIDIGKDAYPRAVDVLSTRLKRGGVALFHNAYYPSPPSEFFEKIDRGPWRATILPTSQGLLIAMRI